MQAADERTASGCAIPGLVLLEKFVVYAAGAYAGRKLDFQIDQSGSAATQIDVAIDEPSAQVLLVLGAYSWRAQPRRIPAPTTARRATRRRRLAQAASWFRSRCRHRTGRMFRRLACVACGARIGHLCGATQAPVRARITGGYQRQQQQQGCSNPCIHSAIPRRRRILAHRERVSLARLAASTGALVHGDVAGPSRGLG